MRRLLLFILFMPFNNALAQSIEGFVLDENSEPIPYAKVWVKNENNLGTITNIYGQYSIAFEQLGSYEIIFSVLGYEEQVITIIIDDFTTVQRNIFLKQRADLLSEVEVSTDKKNVGYEIIKQVMARKDEMVETFSAYSVDVYLKGSETFDDKTKKKNEDDDEPKIEVSFENEGEAIEESSLNLVEKNITIHYQAPKQLKEIKHAEYKIGNPEHIYLESAPIFLDVFFNFYDNLMHKNRLHEGPIISPLHYAGLLSYKYKLTDIITEGQDTIYKVSIKPRNVGNTTLEGDLYIKKHEYVLTKVDLKMHKGNLKTYDDFGILQHYEKIDSAWVVTKQTFTYKTKYGKELVSGQTDVVYKNYRIKPEFGPKFFSNEVALTLDDAYKKDSIYWTTNRPIKLTAEEQRKKFVQDSTIAAHNTKEYLDSIDLAYNEINLLRIFLTGINIRNREKKQEWTLPAVSNLFIPLGVAGPRITAFTRYYKRFDKDQRFFARINPSIGILNNDIRGRMSANYYYNPKKLARLNFTFNHGVELINDFVPYLDYIDPGNYYFNSRLEIGHSFEIFNGFYLSTNGKLSRRSSIADLDFYNWRGEELQTSDPIDFDAYNIFRTDITISYTPGQKFVSEPNEKIVLGSRWPTFSLTHQKGWRGVLNSSANFDNITFVANQRFSIGTIGRSEYRLEVGKFVNQDSVYFIDQKFFRAGDVGLTSLIMSDPLFSFQNLLQAYQTRDVYAQFNYVHSFNGAIINKIPFMKKTRLRSVAGGGMLFLPEYDNLFYQELFFGVQRQFKFLRERIKIGSFVVFSDSNKQPAKVQFKFLFEMVNERDVLFQF